MADKDAALDDFLSDERAQARYWAKVDKSAEFPCWKWRGSLNKGYGTFSYRGASFKPHRLAMHIAGREIPDGLVTDHICRNRACVNPAHLRAVTNRFNVIDNGVGPTAINARKTHCVNGHAFTPNNLAAAQAALGWRGCRLCHNARQQKIKARNRAARRAEKQAASQQEQPA